MATLPNVASLDTISASWANSLIAAINANSSAIDGIGLVSQAVTPAANVTNGSPPVTCYRIGKLVIMDGQMTVAIAMTAEAIMNYGMIPVGFRPARYIYSTCRYGSGGIASAQINPLVIDPSGQFYSVGPAQAAGSQVLMNSTIWTLP